MSIYQDLPKLLAITHISNNDNCPHCGARGKYVYNFRTEDGQSGGAMAGCIKHFPKHELFADSQRIVNKKERYKKEGWNLPSWDREIESAIIGFATGEITLREAKIEIFNSKSKAEEYRRRRRY